VSRKPTKARRSARRRVFVAASADSSPAAYRVRIARNAGNDHDDTEPGARRAGAIRRPDACEGRRPRWADGTREDDIQSTPGISDSRSVTDAPGRPATDARRGIVRGILDEEIALTPGNFFPVPVSIPLERHRSVVASFHRALCALDVASSRREDWFGISVAILRALHTIRGRRVAG
jgi:hypothetical protein